MRITVRVRPGSVRTSVGGRYADGDTLLVSVTVRAVDGAATAAVCRAVADAFGLRRREVTLASGERSRTKILDLAVGGDGEDGVRARLDELLSA